MRLVYKKSKVSGKTKDGKEIHYTNYYIQLDNGRLIQFRCSFDNDWAKVQAVAESLD